MLFISNNKKIDALIKKLQPSLKLKINIERDFDCGLNDVFEKRPDVVFIQNQIAGVTGESVARHIQLLLGGAAPKFIFIHDGDTKAKSKKGLYEYLIDLSQNEDTVAADILEKLNLLLGPQWQNIFVTSVFQGVEYEAFTPAPEPPREPDSAFSFDVVPGQEPVVPGPTLPLSPLPPIPDAAPNESFDVVPSTYGQRSEVIYKECRVAGAKETATISGSNLTQGQILASSESALPSINGDLSAVWPENSTPTDAGSTVDAGKAERSIPEVVQSTFSSHREDSPSPFKATLADQNPFVSVVTTSVSAEKLQIRPSSVAEGEGVTEEVPLVVAQEGLQWVFDGEPSLKKSTWKRYQVVELLLLLSLLLGGWYLIKQKLHLLEPVVNEVDLLKSALSPPMTPESAPAAQQPLPIALPSFIPIAGLDPAFATQNPGWERYVGNDSEFRLFRENGKLKAVQVKADKDHAISESLLKSILVELTGSGEYRVISHGKKLGFMVLNATVNDKAELLIYRKNTAMHAVVVSLD